MSLPVEVLLALLSAAAAGGGAWAGVRISLRFVLERLRQLERRVDQHEAVLIGSARARS